MCTVYTNIRVVTFVKICSKAFWKSCVSPFNICNNNNNSVVLLCDETETLTSYN